MQPWRPVDEGEDCFGWQAEERLKRTSHALRVDGRVWLIDPFDGRGVESRVRALGEPAGVLQLLDRHERDGPALAARLGVEHRRAWESVGDAPFEAIPVCDNRFWHEVALWEPESATLVCADVLGTLPYFRAGGERIGVHPLLRARPPRALLRVQPGRVLVGHGEGVHDAAAETVRDTVLHARRRIPRAALSALRAVSRRA